MNLETELRDALGELAHRLTAQGLRFGTAESCTGGGFAWACTALPGSSDWFEGSIVSYSNAMKSSLLGVPEALLQQFGAVSIETAEAMVRGVQRELKVQAALSITGVAGPSGGSASKPVGTVCFGFAVHEKAWTDIQWFTGDRGEVRRKSLLYASRQINRYLNENIDL